MEFGEILLQKINGQCYVPRVIKKSVGTSKLADLASTKQREAVKIGFKFYRTVINEDKGINDHRYIERGLTKPGTS